MEVLVVTIADATHHEVWLAAIERSEDAPPALGPWQKMDAISGSSSSRCGARSCPQG